MAQFSKITSLVAIHDAITIQRTSHGIPQITASNREDLCYGIGYVHAVDRLVQMMMVRAIARGRASEYFLGSEDLISLDTFMRWLHLEYRIQEEVEKLSPDVRSELDAYCTGLNTALADGRRPLEFFITGYHPDNWTIGDTILTGKILSYLGLAQAQGEGEKFLIQLIQEGVDEARIRALFPGITEPIDYELIQQITLRDEVVPSHLWSRILPRFHSSNNWVVSGEHTRSGHPILAADPHLEIDRLPPIWYEMTWRIGTHTTQGITMPGLPLMVFGRNPNIAWANTYGFMDMMDYFIEECRDGEYLYEGEWLPFEDRHETIVPKGKQPIHLTFYENHHGVLEGDPYQPGKYLTMAFSGR
ncbi:MAG TPA: penicillin acylase family protein, partial [bacterium]|nr:penicillin acylase family protein [bacterium]